MVPQPPQPFLFVADLASGSYRLEAGARHERFCETFQYYGDEDHELHVAGVVLEWIGHRATSGARELARAMSVDVAGALRPLRGTYYGAYGDHAGGVWTFFADHIGGKGLFYYANARTLIVSSSVAAVAREMEAAGVRTTLDREAAYALLTYGYCVDALLPVAGVKQLRAGRYLTCELATGQVGPEQIYYAIPTSPSFPGTFDEAAEQLDEVFARAIERAFARDAVAGLRHAVTLSGGLDSRLVTLVAHELGYVDQLNLTFSNTGSLDEQTPRRIAADLGHEWMFKSLDGGHYIRPIEALSRLLEGRCVIHGAAHVTSLLSRLDWSDLGMLHTGQNGDVIVGRRIVRAPGEHMLGVGAYDATLLHRLRDYRPDVGFADPQQYLFANRFFRGNGASMAAPQALTEVYAPYNDVDVLDLCLSLPDDYRAHHRLYFAWIKRFRPWADRYVWGRNKSKPSARSVRLGTHRYTLRQLADRAVAALPGGSTRGAMHPIDHYYATNDRLRRELDGYLAGHLDLLEDPELRADAEQFYRKGSTKNKLQVVSLLAAAKVLLN